MAGLDSLLQGFLQENQAQVQPVELQQDSSGSPSLSATLGQLFMELTEPQPPAPVSEDPDRQFSGSGVPIEDRFPEAPISGTIADESTAPLSEVDPERRADEEFLRTGKLPETAPSTSLRPEARPVKPEQDFDTTTMSFVEQNEGRKNIPYQDTKGLWTVGVGHLLGKTLPDAYKNPDGTPRTLTDQEVQGLFEADYAKHKAEAAQLPMFSELDALGQQALIDLTFNMGPTKFNEKKWPKFFTALKNKDLEKASKELKNSKWFNEVASRAPKVINLIKGASFK